MAIYSTAKSKFSIGTTKAAAILTDYTSDTFKDIGELEDIGEFGDQSEEITFASISDARMRKAKGVRDGGTIEITVARDPADAGQVALRAALASDLPFNFKVTLADQPATGASPKPTTVYFRALVLGAKNILGSVNDVSKQTFSLSVTSEFVTVEASAS